MPLSENAALLQALVAFHRRERVPRVQRVVAEREVERSAQRPVARLRHDVDEQHAVDAAVILRRELVHARQANRSNLRLRRQLAAREAVDANLSRPAAPSPSALLSISSGSSGSAAICSRVSTVENAVALRIERRRLLVAPDRDVLGDLLDRQRRSCGGVVAGAARGRRAPSPVSNPGNSAWIVYRPGVRRSTVAMPLAAVVTGAIAAAALRRVLRGDRDPGVRNHAARLIGDGHHEPRAGRPAVCATGRGREAGTA